MQNNKLLEISADELIILPNWAPKTASWAGNIEIRKKYGKLTSTAKSCDLDLCFRPEISHLAAKRETQNAGLS